MPIAVTALDAQQLDRAGVQDIRTLGNLSPSFNLNSSQTESQGTTMRIRGVGTTGNNIGLESAVGVFLDGVYLSRPGVALGELVDLQQVEVLRGPQGTLFGRNVSAGALNITTRAPSLSEIEGFGNMTYGNFNMVSTQAGISIPVIEDQLGLRFTVAGRVRDELLESTTGAASNTRDRLAVRGQALWEPTDSLSLRFIADWSKADEECCDAPLVHDSILTGSGAYSDYGLQADGGAPVLGPQALDQRISNGSQFENPFEQSGFSLQADWDVGFGTLTYIGAVRDFKAYSVQDSDFVALEVFTVGGQGSPAGLPRTYDDIHSETHEIRLAGEHGRLNWLVGAYFSNEDIEELQALSLGRDYQRYVGAILHPVLGALIGNPLFLGDNPLLRLASPGFVDNPAFDTNGNYAINQFNQSSESWSVFTHNTFAVTDRLDLTVGLRYVDETKDGSYRQLDANSPACEGILSNYATISGLSSDLAQFALALTCFPFAARADMADPVAQAALPRTFDQQFQDEELIYTANIAYDITDDVNAYVSFTHGFKSGGFNLDSTAAVGGGDPRFASELVDAWEIGLKSMLLDGRVRANFALFHNDIEDFQVLEFTGIRFVTFNVKAVEVDGAEAEFEARLTDGLTGSLGITYTDARYADDCASDPTVAQVAALCGQKLTNAPEWVTIAGLNWERDFGNNLRFFANGTVRWEDDRRTSTQALDPSLFEIGLISPSVDDIQDANTKVNLRFGIGSADESWTLEFWGVNVTDEQTKNVTFNVPLRGAGVLGTLGIPGLDGSNSTARGVFIDDPATYGATLRVQF